MQDADLGHLMKSESIENRLERPLVIDLDGTLLKSDILLETGLAYARQSFTGWLLPFIWLGSGKASLKEQLALATDIDVAMLPYDQMVLELIETERSKGRQIVLATASHITVAQRIAEHIGVFDRVFATQQGINLSSNRKRDLLVQTYGEGGFDYVGNSRDDIEVWKSAKIAYVVNPELGVQKRALALGNVERVMVSSDNQIKAWGKALRLHQWLKNVLIIVPLITAHQLTQGTVVAQAAMAFVLFGMCASSVYLLNDLIDLADDRHHKSKRLRPFASGRIPLLRGLLAWPVLLIGAFAGAALLMPWTFTTTLACYYILTVAYSFWWKRRMALDVIALAMLYTMRIIAGAMAFSLELTFWLLAFSMFIFLSLALVKRYAELHEARQKGKLGKTRGRGYYPGDLEMISSMGSASGYLAVMVLAMYIHDPATAQLYAHPKVIWLACPVLLYWITRVWMLTHRGEMHDDPVMFAAKDRVSLLTGVVFGLVFWVAA